jgi:tetratricopeptide (TPR) repeat protein
LLRSAIFILLFASLPAFSQTSAPTPEPQSPATAPAAAPQSLAPEVAEAEAAIATSDWKSAAAKLTPYIAAHPADPRALFDAGYVADAQNRLDDAVTLYRQAIEADPKSFEAHVSLGLLLARQNKFDDARPELALATNLDAGEVGPLAKARAWRALAQIDRNDDPTEASNDLLEALKLSPKPPTIPCSPPNLPRRPATTKPPRPPIAASSQPIPNPPPPTPDSPTSSSLPTSFLRPKPFSAPPSSKRRTTPPSLPS